MAERVAARMRVRDTELWVERGGRGRLFMTVHGGLGFDHTYFRPWLDALEADAELVHFDLRGQGRSEKLSSEAWETVTHTTWVEDIDALRAQLGHERMVLLGHSYGSYLALDYALAHPERLDALVVCAGTPVFDHVPQIVANAVARGGELGARFVEALSTLFPDDETFARELPQFLPLYFHRWDEASDFLQGTRYCAAALTRAFGVLAPAWSVADQLHEIRTPTLVIVGDDDFIAPCDPCSTRLAAGIPRARLEVIAEAGHFPFVEQPAAFLTAVRRFLGDLDGPAGR